MEQLNTRNDNWWQMVRLALALYVMSLAMGLLPYMAGTSLLQTLMPESFAARIFSVGLFSCAYFILIGKHLRRASFALLAFIIIARLNMPLVGLQAMLLHDTLLVFVLLVTGGWFVPDSEHVDAPGRIYLGRAKLTRVTPPCRTGKLGKAKYLTHALAQSPDEMTWLFDQIGEVY